MPALIGHGIHNGSTLAVGALAVEIPGFTADPGAAVAFQPLWLDALGLALAVGGSRGSRNATGASRPRQTKSGSRIEYAQAGAIKPTARAASAHHDETMAR